MKVYVSAATHLVVDKVECTEKTLCFVATGKWIVTREYVQASIIAGHFLDEEAYQISEVLPDTRLAGASLKYDNGTMSFLFCASTWLHNVFVFRLLFRRWREAMENGGGRRADRAPFAKWRVACLLASADKQDALVRIIKTGHGAAFPLSVDEVNQMLLAAAADSAGGGKGNAKKRKQSISGKQQQQQRLSVDFTLIVYDEASRDEAIRLAEYSHAPYYPFHAIPDYLIQVT